MESDTTAAESSSSIKSTEDENQDSSPDLDDCSSLAKKRKQLGTNFAARLPITTMSMRKSCFIRLVLQGRKKSCS